jgi:hypothetical protein
VESVVAGIKLRRGGIHVLEVELDSSVLPASHVDELALEDVRIACPCAELAGILLKAQTAILVLADYTFVALLVVDL